MKSEKKNIKTKVEEEIKEIKNNINDLNKDKQTILSLPYEVLVDKSGIQNVFNNDYVQEDKEFSQKSDQIENVRKWLHD